MSDRDEKGYIDPNQPEKDQENGSNKPSEAKKEKDKNQSEKEVD